MKNIDMCKRAGERIIVCEMESGRQDLNLRPLTPHASALPGCATPRERESIQRPNQTATDELALAPESFLGVPSPWNHRGLLRSGLRLPPEPVILRQTR